MKQIKQLLYLPFRWLYFGRLKQNLSKHSNQPLVVFDIDNTLAATAPLLKNKSNIPNFYEHLPVIYRMNDVIQNYKEKGYHICFLTARKYSYHDATFTWLKSNGWISDTYQLLIVRFAKDKLAFLQKMKNHSKDTIDYWDDLTYNHEREEIKFYDSVIQEVEQMDWIHYFGYQEIEKTAQNA